ncbi:mitotic interactor and substrate of PLK1 [Nycticebus coucang]|uniref:mitotic interactor and substrate of PLK1 n=1 Tax=Nycticebus coucang TaxID=9470 RepID=UPI00234C443F|nr:mitotic interactor and substrate of PLK1 [Nycticebus coucang]
MDRVTRYPILGVPHSPRVTGLVLDGDTSYTFQLVGVGPEASSWGQDKQQAWSTAPEAWLDASSTEASYSVHSYPIERSPGALYPEDEEDEEMEAYHLDAKDTLSKRPQDLERERWAVIQGQAVRKSGTVATLQGSPDHGDLKAPSPTCPPRLEEDVVDRGQINFLAVRQQFLNLEQASKEGPRQPLARAPPTRVPLGSLNRSPLANGYVIPIEPQMKEVVREEKKYQGFPTHSSIPAGDDSGSWSQVDSPEPPKETPIEREIRLAQEREADLREQRGLRRAAGHELVEIPTRPLLTTASLTAAPRRNRGRPSLYVQWDMVQGTQREEDHRREGLQVSQASTPGWVPEDPLPGRQRAYSSDAILSPLQDAQAADPDPQVKKVNRIPPEAYQPYLNPGNPPLELSVLGRAYSKPGNVSKEEVKAPASPKAKGFWRHLSESTGKPLNTKQECPKPPQGPLRAKRGVVRGEYFRLRPLRFRAPDMPQQAEALQVWGWDVPGGPALRLQRSQSSDLLEREVESVLRREREVAEERRNALFPEVFSPTPGESCGQDSRSSSQASGIMGSYSVSESPLFTPIQLHSGLVWTAEDPVDRAPVQRIKKEQWYAGINPLDRINSEILEATRVTRHKNAMAERWESRIYASEDED